LKGAIEHERRRIALLKSENADRHIAATVIQKTWRGYAYRKQYVKGFTTPGSVDEAQEVHKEGKTGSSVPHMDKVDSSDEYYSYASSREPTGQLSGHTQSPSSTASESDATGDGSDDDTDGDDDGDLSGEEDQENPPDMVFQVTGVADAEQPDVDSDDD
jgi:hypothetical protein